MYNEFNEIHVKINSIDRVKEFVKDTESFSSDIDAILGRYVIDAKSILGIFSLDLTKDILVRIKSEDRKEILHFYEVMSKYID